MTNPTTKTELMALIRETHEAFDALVTGLSDEALNEPGLEGGWSVKGVLAHLTMWEQEFLGWYAAGLRGETPNPFISDEEMNRLNEADMDKSQALPLAEIREKYAASYQQLIDTVEQFTDEELFSDGYYIWTRDRTLLVCLGWVSFEHYPEHGAQIQRWLDARN